MRNVYAIAFWVGLVVWPAGARADAAPGESPPPGSQGRPAPEEQSVPLSADREAAARAEFDLGVSELRAEKWSDAERSFRRSLSAAPRASTLYDLAFVLLKQGRLRASIDAVRTLERAPELPDRERYREAAIALERWATNGLSVVSIVPSPASARVLVDGEATVPYGGALRARVDPGSHRVEVGAKSFTTRVSSVTTAYGGVVEERVVLARPSSEKAPAAGSSASPWPWVTAGIGGAALVAGIITGAFAKQADNELTSGCPELHDCDPALAATRDRALTLGYVANALIISGGAVAAGGVTWGLVNTFTAAPAPNGFVVTGQARF